MAKARDYHLTSAELKQIEKAIKHDKRSEVVQRSMAIRLLHFGHKAEEVAQMQAVSKPTIYGWFHRWQRGGVEVLANLNGRDFLGARHHSNRFLLETQITCYVFNSP
jgi:hypothetical protein